MLLSALYKLFHGGQFLLVEELGVTTDFSQESESHATCGIRNVDWLVMI